MSVQNVKMNFKKKKDSLTLLLPRGSEFFNYSWLVGEKTSPSCRKSQVFLLLSPPLHDPMTTLFLILFQLYS